MEKGFKEFMLVICEGMGCVVREKGCIVCMYTPDCQSYDYLRESFNSLSEIEKEGYIQCANNLNHSVWIH